METALYVINNAKSVRSTVDTLWWLYGIYSSIKKKFTKKKVCIEDNDNKPPNEATKVSQ